MNKNEMFESLKIDDNMFTVFKVIARIEEYYFKEDFRFPDGDSNNPSSGELKDLFLPIETVYERLRSKSSCFQNRTNDYIFGFIHELANLGFVTSNEPSAILESGIFIENLEPNFYNKIIDRFEYKNSQKSITKIRLTNVYEVRLSGEGIVRLFKEEKEKKKMEEGFNEFRNGLIKSSEENFLSFKQQYTTDLEQIKIDVNKKLQDNILRNIEVMSIFVAILAIIITNIFQTNTSNLKDILIVNLIVLMSIITLFSCIEFFIVKSFTRKKKVAFFLLLLLLAGLLIAIYFIIKP